MIKHIKLLLIILLTNKMIGQVGINTNNPQATLDINGTLNIRQELRINGTDTAKGEAGTLNQLFAVKEVGTDVADEWKTIVVADGTGSLRLFYLNTTVDNNGIEFSRSGATVPYQENTAFTTSGSSSGVNWVRLEKNKDNFTITDRTKQSKAILSFQTTVQLTPLQSNGEGDSASYACGIFVKKDNGSEQLKGVRSDIVRGGAGSYSVYNFNVTLDNLDAGYYAVSVACSNRQLGSGIRQVKLGIGRPVNNQYLNRDMAQSTLTTTVLQPY